MTNKARMPKKSVSSVVGDKRGNRRRASRTRRRVFGSESSLKREGFLAALAIWSMGNLLAVSAISAQDQETVPFLDQFFIETNLIAAVIQQEDDISVTAEEYLAIYSTTRSSVDSTSAASSESVDVTEEVVAENQDVVDTETVVAAADQEQIVNTGSSGEAPRSDEPGSVSNAPVSNAQPEPEPTEVAAVDVSAESAEQSGSVADAAMASSTLELFSEVQTVRDWAAAWSNQDVDSYLGFYAPEFVPNNRQLSRKAWEKQRRERVSRPARIDVALTDISVMKISDSRSEARFTQAYESDTYRDRIIKAIELVRTELGWRIIGERTVKALSN